MKEKFISARTKPEMVSICEKLGMTLPRETKRSTNNLREKLAKVPYSKLINAHYQK